MPAFAIVVAYDLEGQMALQLLGCDQGITIFIQIKLRLEAGGKTLHQGVVPAAPRGGNAAEDHVMSQQIAVVDGPVLSALIRMEEQHLELHLSVAKAHWRTLSTRVAPIDGPSVHPTTRRVKGRSTPSCNANRQGYGCK